jgi:hypothetical protein
VALEISSSLVLNFRSSAWEALELSVISAYETPKSVCRLYEKEWKELLRSRWQHGKVHTPLRPVKMDGFSGTNNSSQDSHVTAVSRVERIMSPIGTVFWPVTRCKALSR